MQKVLIDDNCVDPQGNKYQLWIYYYESGDPEVGETTDTEILTAGEQKLLLELQFGTEIGVPGYELVRVKVAPDEVETIESRFSLAPDQAYSLYKHWQDVDDKIRVEDRDDGEWEIQRKILVALKNNFPDKLQLSVVRQDLSLDFDDCIYAIATLVREYFVQLEKTEQGSLISLTPRGYRELQI